MNGSIEISSANSCAAVRSSAATRPRSASDAEHGKAARSSRAWLLCRESRSMSRGGGKATAFRDSRRSRSSARACDRPCTRAPGRTRAPFPRSRPVTTMLLRAFAREPALSRPHGFCDPARSDGRRAQLFGAEAELRQPSRLAGSSSVTVVGTSRRTDARAQLRAAHDEFLSIGMEAFAERARRELSATGETAASVPRRRVTSSPHKRPKSRASRARASPTPRSAPACTSADGLSSTTYVRSSPSSASAPAPNSTARRRQNRPRYRTALPS